MKHFFGIFLFCFFFNAISAQEKHFVFIQSENKQPFYVSVNGKLFSSTATGYLIVPKLVNGSYNFTLGFAQNAFPEQTFTTAIQDKDLGFELKNLGDKGWALFNLQSLEISTATTASSNVVAKALNEKSNATTTEAVISFDKKKNPVQETSKAPADSTINTTVAEAEVPKKSSQADTAAIPEQKTAVETQNAPGVVIKTTASNSKKSGEVKKVAEVSSDDGLRLFYVDGSGKNTDTIQVVIPSSGDTKVPLTSSSPAPTNSSPVNSEVSSAAGNANAGKNDVKFLDINMNAKKDSSSTPVGPGETFKVMENSNCKNIATDEDYSKLRKRMATETTDDKMIIEAKKVYRNKCFTTSQIKGLSTLFLSDEGRFKFFDASFVSVADANQYYTLQSEFIDPAFVNRFKGLLQ